MQRHVMIALQPFSSWASTLNLCRYVSAVLQLHTRHRGRYYSSYNEKRENNIKKSCTDNPKEKLAPARHQNHFMCCYIKREIMKYILPSVYFKSEQDIHFQTESHSLLPLAV